MVHYFEWWSENWTKNSLFMVQNVCHLPLIQITLIFTNTTAKKLPKFE